MPADAHVVTAAVLKATAARGDRGHKKDHEDQNEQP